MTHSGCCHALEAARAAARARRLHDMAICGLDMAAMVPAAALVVESHLTSAMPCHAMPYHAMRRDVMGWVGMAWDRIGVMEGRSRRSCLDAWGHAGGGDPMGAHLGDS